MHLGTVYVCGRTYVVSAQKADRLNQMLRRLPPGILVDSAWLKDQGLSRSSIHGYVVRGWLEHIAPRLYRRPTDPARSGPISWELAVASAQVLAKKPFHIGGATAIDLLGLSHYLRLSKR